MRGFGLPQFRLPPGLRGNSATLPTVRSKPARSGKAAPASSGAPAAIALIRLLDLGSVLGTQPPLAKEMPLRCPVELLWSAIAGESYRYSASRDRECE